MNNFLFLINRLGCTSSRIGVRRSRRALLMAILLLLQSNGLLIQPAWADKTDLDGSTVCATPGIDGTSPTGGQVNTFYPGTAATVSSGSQSLVLGAGTPGMPPIAKGDLLMIIQMQGAEIDSNNTAAYGDGDSANNPNQGATDYPANGVVNGNTNNNFAAGNFEYSVAASDVPLSGGTLTLTTPLLNSYANTLNSGINSQGQKRFQVIRVPQYSSATISGTLTASAWDGLKGGVFAMDVAGSITFSGGVVNMSGSGFRGGVGKKLNGVGNTLPALSNIDVVTPSTRPANASKGEGIAGTPIGLTIDGTVSTVEGYLGGSHGRGAPGNAGGGGTDGNPVNNQQNAGGGGGSNGGVGGKGGRTWSSALPYGGDGGAPFPASAQRLVLGGGGGAGTNNDGTTSSASPIAGGLASSGANGGGIVMIRAANILGNGNVNANGLKPSGIPGKDASGGGGAGGSILVVTESATIPATVKLNAIGGEGGTNTGSASPITATNPGSPHGPGGGGAGGVIFATPGALTNVAPGNSGTTASGSFGGATAGTGVIGPVTTTPADTITMIAGANCLLKTTKQNNKGPFQAPGSTTYTITVTNPAGLKRPEARNVEIRDAGLPTGFTHNPIAISPVYTGGATGPATVTATGTTTQPIWAGPFNIPPGGTVAITFGVDVAASVVPGTYHNSATAEAKYINTNAGGVTVSPNLITSSYNGNLTANTADDVIIVASSPLSVNKTVALVADKDGSGGTTALASQTPTPGDVLEYTIVTTNPSTTTTALGVILKDNIPANVTYLPNSLQVEGTARTDASGDDVAEFASNQVVARLGTGASSTIGGSLGPSATSTVKFQVTINDPIAPTGTTTVSNQAIVSFAGNPDQPSNDPSTPPPNDPTVTKIGPRVRLVKRITGIKRKVDGSFTVIGGYHDDSKVDDNSNNWPGGNTAKLLGITDSAQLPVASLPAPGDEVEYTIYWLSDGAMNAQGVNLCDFIPIHQTYVNSTIELNLNGTTTAIADAPTGPNASGFYTGTPPAACTGTNNGNGAVHVQVGNLPVASSTPSTAAYGFFRFRAKVN